MRTSPLQSRPGPNDAFRLVGMVTVSDRRDLPTEDQTLEVPATGGPGSTSEW